MNLLDWAEIGRQNTAPQFPIQRLTGSPNAYPQWTGNQLSIPGAPQLLAAGVKGGIGGLLGDPFNPPAPLSTSGIPGSPLPAFTQPAPTFGNPGGGGGTGIGGLSPEELALIASLAGPQSTGGFASPAPTPTPSPIGGIGGGGGRGGLGGILFNHR